MDISTIVKVIDLAAIYKAGLNKAYEVLQTRVNQLMTFRKLLGQIEFQCGWDNAELCFAELREQKQHPMCCCRLCPSNVGYMKEEELPVLKVDLPKYQEMWTDERGFWTPSGCSLPVVLRSTTCLTYNCLHLVGTSAARDKRMVINDVRFSMDLLAKEIITINERIVL